MNQHSYPTNQTADIMIGASNAWRRKQKQACKEERSEASVAGAASGEGVNKRGGGFRMALKRLGSRAREQPASEPTVGTANAGAGSFDREEEVELEGLARGMEGDMQRAAQEVEGDDARHAHVARLSADEEAFWCYSSPGVDAPGYLKEDGPPAPGQAMHMLREALLLLDDHRFRVADHVVKRLEALLVLSPAALKKTGHTRAEQEELAKAWEDATVKERVATIKRRWGEVEAVIRDMNEPGEWTHGQDLWGVRTDYQLNYQGRLRMRLQGNMVGRMMDQVAIIRESDHYRAWLPTCSDSRLLHATKLTEALWFHLAIPMFNRDAIIETYGVDNEGAILFLQDKALARVSDTDGRAYDRMWEERGVVPPPEPRGWGACRMGVVDFQCKMDITGPESFHTTMILTVDVRAPLPAWLVNLATKKVAGLFLYLITKETKKMRSAYDTHPVAAIMRKDPFYRLYLEPRLRDYFTFNGWEFHGGALEGTNAEAEKNLHRLRSRSVSRLDAAGRAGTPVPPAHVPPPDVFGSDPENEETEAATTTEVGMESPVPLRFSPPPASALSGEHAADAAPFKPQPQQAQSTDPTLPRSSPTTAPIIAVSVVPRSGKTTTTPRRRRQGKGAPLWWAVLLHLALGLLVAGGAGLLREWWWARSG